MKADLRLLALLPPPIAVALPTVIVVRKQLCGVRDGDHGECNLLAGHGGGSVIHTEWRDGKIWANWRSVLWEDECVCHVPRDCKVHPKV